MAGENDQKDAAGGQPQFHCGLWTWLAGRLFASINYCSFEPRQLPSVVKNHNGGPEVGHSSVPFSGMPLHYSGEKSILKSIMCCI